MPKIIVAIEMSDHFTKEQLEEALWRKDKDDWFPLEDKSLISIDEAYLKRDPTESSYYLFEYISIQD